MAKRDPYFVPRRSGDVSGPLIRWTIILGLTAAGAAAAYHFMSSEQSRPAAIEARETAAPSPPQYVESAPQLEHDATALDSSASAEAAAVSDVTAPDGQTAEPPLSEPAAAPAPEPRPRPRRRAPPPPPRDEPTPPPTANFPVEPPVENPTPPPPT